MSVLGISLLLFFLLLQAVERSTARGVLSIKLLSFENPKGRTYEGQCCDPSPLDGDTCHDKCDYVMRLIIAGLGRANDHVFLFHRPLKYDSNDLHFQEHGGGDLTLTVLYDQWPSEGHVKMNAFFYDYDDFDHTTALVDWFETELSSDGQARQSHSGIHVNGNRQQDKTRLVFQWSRHCVGGLEDDEDCPSASTNLAQEDLVFPGEHGQLSGEGRQQLFYQHKNEEAHPMKSPFRPFSTRKNNLDLHRLISSHSPDIMNDGYGQVTAGPGPSRGHGVRSEYQHKHNRQRQESVFVEDPLRIVKESKAEKYLDTDLTEDSSKPRHHQKGPNTETLLDYSRPRHRPMTPPNFKKDAKVLTPRTENADVPRLRHFPDRAQETSTPVAHKTEKQTPDVPGKNLRQGTGATRNSEDEGTSPTGLKTDQSDRKPLPNPSLEQSRQRPQTQKIPENHQRIGTSTDTSKTETLDTKNEGSTLSDLKSTQREISKALNFMRNRQRQQTAKPDTNVRADKGTPVTRDRHRDLATKKDQGVESKSPFAPPSRRSSAQKGDFPPETTTAETVFSKKPGKLEQATKAQLKTDTSTKIQPKGNGSPFSKLHNGRIITRTSPSTKTLSTTTAASATTSTAAKSSTSFMETTTARPEGWGPLHKNRFVTWIPATPKAAWVPGKNQGHQGKPKHSSHKPRRPSGKGETAGREADSASTGETGAQAQPSHEESGKPKPAHPSSNRRVGDDKKLDSTMQRVVKGGKGSDARATSNQKGSRQRPQLSKQRPRKPTKTKQTPFSPLPPADSIHQAGRDGSARTNVKSAHDKKPRKHAGNGKSIPISLRKKDHSASLEPQISGQIIKQENVTPPHDKKPRKHVVLKDAQPISPREKDQGASLEPQPSGGKVKQDNGQRTVKHSHTAKPRKPGKVGNTNPLLVHKQQQEWLKGKKRENLNRKLPEHGHRGVEHVKPPTPSTYTTLEINPKTKTQTKEMTSTTLTTSQGRDQEDQLTSAASGTSSSPRTSTVHSTAPFPRQNTRRRQPSTEKGEKTSPTKSSQEAAVRRPDNKPASTGPSTPPSVLTRDKYSSPVHTAAPSTTSLLSRHLEIVRAIEAADVAQKATEPVTTQSVLTTVPTKRSNLQRKGSTKRHQTAEVSTTTPYSSRRQSPAFPTKQTRGTELKTTISTYETESDRTDLFVSTETSTTPFTTTRQPDNENEEPDTSSTRAESMKRVKTQTFQTPTEVMWYVTTHPAYVKTNPRFVTHYSDVEIRRKDDTTSPTEHLPPRQSGEQKYHIPKDIKSPFEQPEIRVQKVRTQEKNEQKKRRRFRPLKSRLDLVQSLTYPTNTDVLTPASLKPTDERRHQFQQSPFSSPETQLIKTQKESATTSHSLTTKTHDLSSNKESHGTKSPDTQFRKSPFEAPQRNKTPETVVQSTTGAFTTSSVGVKSSTQPTKKRPEPSNPRASQPMRGGSGRPSLSVDTPNLATDRKGSSREQTKQSVRNGRNNMRNYDLETPGQVEGDSRLSVKDDRLSKPSQTKNEPDNRINEVDYPDAARQKPVPVGSRRTQGRIRGRFTNPMKKPRHPVPSDLSHKNPFLKKNTQGQATLTLRQSKGRLSSLYTSSINGTKINPSLVSEDRLIVPPFLESAPRRGSKYREETELERVETTVSGANLHRTVKTMSDKPRNQTNKTMSITEASSLLESTLLMLKETKRKRGQKKKNGAQTSTTHSPSSASSKVTLETTSHSDGSKTSSAFAGASVRPKAGDSPIKGLSSLPPKSAQKTVNAFKLGSTTERGPKLTSDRLSNTRLSSSTFTPKNKPPSPFSLSSLLTTPPRSASSVLPENKQTKTRGRITTATSTQGSYSTRPHESGVNSLAAKSPSTKTHHMLYTLSTPERNETEPALKTKLSTSDPQPSAPSYVSLKSTGSTKGERKTTLMTVSGMSRTNTPSNASRASPAHETSAESKRPSEDRGTSINRTGDLFSKVYPQDVGSASVAVPRPLSVLSPRPRGSGNTTHSVSAGRIESKHSTAAHPGSVSVAFTASSRLAVFSRSTTKPSNPDTEDLSSAIKNLKNGSKRDKEKGDYHTRTSLAEHNISTKSGTKPSITTSSTSAAPSSTSKSSNRARVAHRGRPTASASETTRSTSNGSNLNETDRSTVVSLSAVSKERESLVSLFNDLANIISSSIATVKNATLETSSAKNEPGEAVSASTKFSLRSTTTPPELTISRSETTVANTTSTPAQNRTEVFSPFVSGRLVSVTTEPALSSSTKLSSPVTPRGNFTTTNSASSLQNTTESVTSVSRKRTPSPEKRTTLVPQRSTGKLSSTDMIGVSTATVSQTNTSSLPTSSTYSGAKTTTEIPIQSNTTVHSAHTTGTRTLISSATNPTTTGKTDNNVDRSNSTRDGRLNNTSPTSVKNQPNATADHISLAAVTKKTAPGKKSTVGTTRLALSTILSTVLQKTSTVVPTTITTTQKKLTLTKMTTPKKLKLTLPDWITFPNKFKNFQNMKAKTTPTTTRASTTTTTTSFVPKASTKPSVKHKDLDGVKLPESVLKALEDQFLGQNKNTIKTEAGVKTIETVRTQEAINVKETVKSQETIKVIPTLPDLEMLLNVSAPGPKVVVPKDGLFKPEFDHHGNLGNSSRDRTGLSGSRERHVGVHLQKMSVGTVFNRYWPAILGLTVGTVFLVVALLTSIACRQQRLFIQRRQWQQDTPQHLTEPPDTSEYSSSSASSLVSDHTRSSINFT